MPSSRVFDSWAIIAFLQREPAGPAVRSLIIEAAEAGAPSWITAVNLGEVWYNLARKHSDSDADAAAADLERIGFQVRSIDWDLARQAAVYKARYSIGYADCFAAALAKQLKVELVTGDRDFKRLEKEVKIRWV